MLSFVLSCISLFLIFVMKSFIGIVFAIAALIVALIKIKSKKTLNYIGLFLSILMLIYSAFSFIVASKSVNGIVNTSKAKTYKNIEKSLANGAIITVKQYEKECAKSGSNCALPPTLREDLDYAYGYDDFKSTLKNCDGYIDIKYESLEWTAKVYLKCPDYKTDGYESKSEY